MSDKIDFKMKTAIRDKEVHYIMITGAIQEDITILNTNAANIGEPQYIRQILTGIKGESDSNTIIVRDTHNGILLIHRKNKILPFTAT